MIQAVNPYVNWDKKLIQIEIDRITQDIDSLEKIILEEKVLAYKLATNKYVSEQKIKEAKVESKRYATRQVIIAKQIDELKEKLNLLKNI